MNDTRRNLSEHFTIDEASHSDYAKKSGIDNELPSIFYDNARLIARHILEPIRERFGAFSPQSWYRGVALNKAVGGRESSQHCKAQAVDFEVKGYNNLEVALWVRDNLIYDQLILENYNGESHSGWIHISWVKGVNRQQAMRYNGTDYKAGLE